MFGISNFITYICITIKTNKDMKTFQVTNIDYCVDGEIDINELPETLTIKIPDSLNNESEITDYISNEISNITGFLNNGFSIN